MIKLIMSNCADMIDTYSEYIKARSRYVYTTVLNSLVESKTNYIVIDDPNSYPFIKGQSTPLMELGDISTFVTIRLNPHYNLRPHFIQLFYKFTVLILNYIGINHRAGYGFAETTATFINVNDRKIIIRISIGSEEPKVLVENFNQLKTFFVQFNRVISTYFPFTHEPLINISLDKELMALRDLTEVYINQFPDDINLPLVRLEAEEFLKSITDALDREREHEEVVFSHSP